MYVFGAHFSIFKKENCTKELSDDNIILCKKNTYDSKTTTENSYW